MMYKRINGYTLIELLLYIGVFSLLVVTIFQLFSSILDVQISSQSKSSIYQDSQFIIERFRYDIQRASLIISPPVGESSSSAVFTADGNSYSYSSINGDLILSDLSSTYSGKLNSLATTVSNLTFMRSSDTQGKNNDALTVSFTLTSNFSQRSTNKSENFKTTAVLRKKN